MKLQLAFVNLIWRIHYDIFNIVSLNLPTCKGVSEIVPRLIIWDNNLIKELVLFYKNKDHISSALNVGIQA